ncbi:hypothetical protein C0J52_12705 [Blattella germanica]|nr:hypothetical protein C0J52_12705 [Blattella germanica]
MLSLCIECARSFTNFVGTIAFEVDYSFQEICAIILFFSLSKLKTYGMTKTFIFSCFQVLHWILLR